MVTLGVDNKVIWTNRDSVQESVVSNTSYVDKLTGKKFDSGSMDSGDTFEFTFTKPGDYPYHAEPHPWIRGEILVREGAVTFLGDEKGCNSSGDE